MAGAARRKGIKASLPQEANRQTVIASSGSIPALLSVVRVQQIHLKQSDPGRKTRMHREGDNIFAQTF